MILNTNAPISKTHETIMAPTGASGSAAGFKEPSKRCSPRFCRNLVIEEEEQNTDQSAGIVHYQVGAQTECEDFATGMESQMERSMTKTRSSSSSKCTLTRKWSSSTDQIDICMATVASAEVLSSKEAIATGFPQHSAHEASIPPCVKMLTEVKDFTKELEVEEPATMAVSGEAETVFMNKGCQQKFFFTTLTAVEQSQFMVVSRKDKRNDVRSTTPKLQEWKEESTLAEDLQIQLSPLLAGNKGNCFPYGVP
jgi:hypothetical protein